jgi:hypothetical protein
MVVQSSGYAHTPGMDPRTYHHEKRQAEALKNLCLTAKNFVSYSILKVSNTVIASPVRLCFYEMA